MFRPTYFLATSILALSVSAAEPEIFTIRTLPAQMRYDVSDLVMKPGAEVKIIFENADDMPHNMVFFQPGTDVVAVCNKQMEKPEEALKRDWLPDDARIWLHTRLVNPKTKEELVFKAPEKPGTYPFVCTFPGHALTMQGRLKVFPPAPKLSALKFQTYLGDWKTLPDFSKLTPHREGTLPENLVEIKFDDYRNQFGVVYSAKLNAPLDGEYTFAITGDDGVRVIIDGKKVAEYDGIHPAGTIKEGKLKLKTGEHDFRLEYFQAAGQSELFAAWSGPNFAMTPLSKWLPENWSKAGVAKKTDENVGMPIAIGDEAIIYRNFIAGAGNRGIGVGYPGGFNLAWNSEQMNLAEVWRGAFIDAARHWNGRGGGAQPPLGYDIFKPSGEMALPFAVPASADAQWPRLGKEQRAADYQWEGYRLDAKRYPTFSYRWNGLKVTDGFVPEGNAVTGPGKLVRTLTLAGNIPAGAMFCAASGNTIVAGADGSFSIDGAFNLTVEGAKIAGKNLLVPARSEIKLTYSWPGNHADHVHAH